METIDDWQFVPLSQREEYAKLLYGRFIEIRDTQLGLQWRYEKRLREAAKVVGGQAITSDPVSQAFADASSYGAGFWIETIDEHGQPKRISVSPWDVFEIGETKP